MSALRDTENKLDWAMLFEHFPLAMQELCKARMYGARHYTKNGKDGVTNWKESINGPEHDRFLKGCIRGSISHKFKRLWGQERDEPQDNVHHLAFSALNDLMALEYDLSKENAIEHQEYQEDPAWEIDQLVTWIGGDYRFWYFNEHGFICYGHFAPKFNDKSTLHSVAHHMTVTMVPEHLRKHWKESVRKRQ
jgi:hypothetical protein